MTFHIFSTWKFLTIVSLQI